MEISDLFWSASIPEIMQGYVYQPANSRFTCLVCGQSYTKGVVYPAADLLLEAERAVEQHIRREHKSMFSFLLNMNKSYTGLTGQQKDILLRVHHGEKDKQIAADLGGVSASTIRSHRFKLREKQKQAKVLLALMGLLGSENADSESFIEPHRGATMVDDRYVITVEEKEQTLKKYLNSNGTLKSWPSKQKRKLIVLQHLITLFDSKKKYSEKEVNSIIGSFYPDYVTLRRYLIEYGFMDRVRDGSSYWVKA